MPNPWKKFRAGGSGGGVSRLLAGLRPPEQGGSLVVQTGFPTSLADLVVKNRDRLKKPSRRKKPAPPPPGFDSGASATFVSSSSTFATSSIPSPPSNVSPRPGPNPPVPEAADSSSPSPLAFSVTVSRRIEFLLVVMVILMALAIERSKLVAAIMLSAFVLRLFDWNGFLLIWFSNPRSEAKSTLNSSVKDWELEGKGVVSPIREITTDSTSETARSERSSVDLIQRKGIALKRTDAEKVHLEPDPGPSANSKLKKFLRKFLSKKFHRRKCHKEKGALVQDSSKNAILGKITEVEEASNGDADPDIENEENTVSIVASDKVSDHDIRLFQEGVHETKSRNSQVKQLLEKNDEGHVIATCRNPNQATGLLDLKNKFLERLSILPLDVTKENTIEAAATTVKESFGKLNLLINASGILSVPDVLQPETTLSKVQKSSLLLAYEVNAIGPILVIKHMWPLLKAGGGFGTEKKHAIIASLSARVGSIGDNGLGGWHSYRASKTALNQLTKTISVEFGQKKDPIVCILLHPGTVDTDLSRPFQRNVPPGKLFTKEVSVQKMLSIIDNIQSSDNGKFFAWDGQEIPW